MVLSRNKKSVWITASVLVACLLTLAAGKAHVFEINSYALNTPFGFASIFHLHGRFEPSNAPGFVKVDTPYCYKDMYLLDEVYESFKQMAEAAAKDSIDLKIISATRTFDHQKYLWETKWTGKTKVEGFRLTESHKNSFHRAKKIMEYTAPPGFSRHHWGTEIDINSVEDDYFQSEVGDRVFKWLQKNAGQFGFCQTYTSRELRDGKGFNEEKWHWSYTRISIPLLEEMLRQFDVMNITDFKGYEEVRQIDLINEYILPINTCH